MHVEAPSSAPTTSECERQLREMIGGIAFGTMTETKGWFVATVHPETTREREARIARSADEDEPKPPAVLSSICSEHLTGAQLSELLRQLKAHPQK